MDAKPQIIVDAQAHGTGSEQELFVPIVAAIAPLLAPDSLVTADAGYHSEANLQALEARGIDALVADNGLRRRDERFAGQVRYRDLPDPLYDKTPAAETPALFAPRDFRHDPKAQNLRLSSGKQALPQRRQHRYPGLHRCAIPRRRARLHALPTATPLPA